VCRADHSSRGVVPIVECVTECDGESSIMRRPLTSGGSCVMKNIVTPISKDVLRLFLNSCVF
jgi:hypothetical protein